jgi:predicted transcriptional regulator
VIILPCVSADGKPTKSGVATLTAINNGAKNPETVSENTGQPMFKIRSGLRELENAGFVKKINSEYQLTEKGAKFIIIKLAN